MLGLYVHVPFCSAICNYCNFNRGLFDAALKARYVEALITEIARRRGSDEAAGCDDSTEAALRQPGIGCDGAPTIVAQPFRAAADAPTRSTSAAARRRCSSPTRSRASSRACESSFDVAADREVTLEANPESVSESRLAAFRDAGVNRLSFGVQSFREDELRRLSRLHSADRARAALGEARAAGFDNVSLDLMMWLPGQSVGEWLESVDARDRARARAPVALHARGVSERAAQGRNGARPLVAGARRRRGGDVQSRRWSGSRRRGSSSTRSRTSRAAAAARATTSNTGPTASGSGSAAARTRHAAVSAGRTFRPPRSTSIASARGAALAVDVRRLTPEEQLGDALFTALRLVDGIDGNAIQTRYGVDVWRRYGADLEPFIEAGCLRRDGARLSLTRQGMLVAHEIMTVFV